jgi:hypothetical protein
MIKVGLYLVVDKPWWADKRKYIHIIKATEDYTEYKYFNLESYSSMFTRESIDFRGDWLVPVSGLLKELI